MLKYSCVASVGWVLHLGSGSPDYPTATRSKWRPVGRMARSAAPRRPSRAGERAKDNAYIYRMHRRWKETTKRSQIASVVVAISQPERASATTCGETRGVSAESQTRKQPGCQQAFGALCWRTRKPTLAGDPGSDATRVMPMACSGTSAAPYMTTSTAPLRQRSGATEVAKARDWMPLQSAWSHLSYYKYRTPS